MEWKRLLDVSKINDKSVEVFKGTKRYVATGGIDYNEIVDYEDVTYESKPSRANRQIEIGDILVAKMKETVKVFNIADENYCEYIFSTGFTTLKANENILDNNYFYYVLISEEFQEQKDKYSKGATQKAINNIGLGKITIPVPPLPVQKQIVEVLDEAQNLIDNKKEQIGLLDDLIESLLIYEVGPMSKRYDEWKEMQIKDVVLKNKGSMRTGPFGSDLLHSEFVSEGIYVLGIDNVVENRFTWGKERYITEEKYEKLKRYTVYPEDVLISIMGTTGRSAVVPKEIELAINTKHLACLTLNRDLINPYFLSLSIHLNPTILTQIRLRNKGAIMNGLNLTIIKELKIKVPPIQLQNQFAEKVELIEKQKSLLQQSLKLLEDNYNNLMQRAFKGELF